MQQVAYMAPKKSSVIVTVIRPVLTRYFTQKYCICFVVNTTENLLMFLELCGKLMDSFIYDLFSGRTAVKMYLFSY